MWGGGRGLCFRVPQVLGGSVRGSAGGGCQGMCGQKARSMGTVRLKAGSVPAGQRVERSWSVECAWEWRGLQQAIHLTKKSKLEVWGPKR